MPGKIVFLTPAQCRAARALLNWSQQDLANAAHVSREAIRDFESLRHQMQEKTASAVMDALSRAGVLVIRRKKLGEGVFLKPAG